MLTNRQMPAVFNKILNLFNFLSKNGIGSFDLKNAKILILGDGQLATLAEKWFKDQGGEVKTLSIRAHLGKKIMEQPYLDAVGEASVIVNACVAADSSFLASAVFRRQLRDQATLINLSSTPFEFGLNQFLGIRSALINSLPLIARTFRLSQKDDSMKRIFMLGDGHPMIDMLHIGSDPELTVAALLLASKELLTQTELPGRLSDIIRPSIHIHDLLGIGSGS